MFGPSYTLSLFAALAINTVLTAGHESFHWLAAQAQGAGARFSLGHRFFLPTLDTDLSQLLALPRRAHVGPLLAGIAFDGLLLGCVLSIQLGAARGWYGMSSTASSLLAVASLILVLRLAFQPLIFLRSDLYAVMTTLLGCRNLYRVSLLLSKKRLFGLSVAERHELDNSHARDLQVGRYFSIVYMLGLVWAAWMLWVFVVLARSIYSMVELGRPC